MYRPTSASKARDIEQRWKYNRRVNRCACGREDRNGVIGRECWFAAPEEYREAWRSAYRANADAKKDAAALLIAFASKRKESL